MYYLIALKRVACRVVSTLFFKKLLYIGFPISVGH